MQPAIGEEAEVRTEVEVCTDEGYFLYSVFAKSVINPALAWWTDDVCIF